MSKTEDSGEPGTSTPKEQPKRKRGRPRKQLQEPYEQLSPKKPRGRPKGSKKLKADSGQMVHTSVEKKPRGRPRKWLVAQKKRFQESGTEEKGNSSSKICPSLEDISGKGCPRSNTNAELKGLRTSSAMLHQPSAF